MRCAVVGHVEWTEFARMPAAPRAGEIVHATELWEEPGGGGAVIAAQLAKLAGRCELFTALGDDALGHRATRRLAELGKRVALVERKSVIGGTCINTGTIPSKTLRETALYFSGLRQRGQGNGRELARGLGSS